MAEIDSLELRISAEMSEASSSIDKLCSRLDVLSKSVGRIGTSSDGNFKKLNLAYSKIGNMFNKSSTASKSLTSSLVKAYATVNLIERGFDRLSHSIKNSMDYVETYNYWSVALDKIANDFSGQFEVYGFQSAETYAKSFSERLKQLNKKMTGYAIGDNGELQLTDQIGVGLDIGKLMNYQAKILSVTNSVGLLGETSIDVSKVMSMLASDFSSLTNTDLDTVMTNLQSGLIGQSRALYKYGIDITNATLQTYAYEHGITKAVTAMSQGEKMQLRVLAILDQSKVAWGDVANTMNSVANQWRIMGQQVSNVSRLFGTLLLPIVQKVLPVVNGLLIALQKLMSTIGFKMWGDTWLKDTMSGISSGGVAEVENLDESLGNASESAKKLKTHLLGIDELNVVEPADNSGMSMGSVGGGIDLSSDISAALAEYESVWDKAFAESLNKAQEYADKFIGVANKLWNAIEPLRNSVNKLWNEGFSLLMGYTFQNLKDFYTEFIVPFGTWAFGTEGQGLTRLVDIINNSLLQIDWPFITQNLKNFWIALEPFAESVGEGLITFFEDISNLSVSVINELFGREGAIQKVTDFLNRFDPQKAEKLGYSLGVLAVGLTALSGIGKILSGISGIGKSIIALSEGLGAIFGSTGIFASIGSTISGTIGPVLANFKEMIDLVAVGAGTLGESFAACFPNLASVVSAITPMTALLAALAAGIGYVFATNEEVRGSFAQLATTLSNGIAPVLSEIANGIGNTLSNMLSSLYNNVLAPLGNLMIKMLTPALLVVSDLLSMLTTSIIIPLAETLGSVFLTSLESVNSVFDLWIGRLTPIIETMQFLWQSVMIPIAEYLWTGFKPKFETAFQVIGEVITNLGKSLEGLIKFVTGIFTGDWRRAWDGVKDIFKGIFNNIVTIAESVINKIVNGINHFISGFNGLVDKVGNVIGIDIKLPTIKNVQLSRFETGGYPTSASLFWAGENGVPEILGTVGGKTAVAGGAEITGIRDAVYDVGNSETTLLRMAVSLLETIAAKDTATYIDGRELVNAYDERKSRNGFSFT